MARQQPLSLPLRANLKNHGMRKVLVLGAGRSSSSLIAMVLERAERNDWEVHVGDVDEATAQAKCQGHPAAHPFRIDPKDPTERNAHIASSDLVISMVPAFMHPETTAVTPQTHVVSEQRSSVQLLTFQYTTPPSITHPPGLSQSVLCTARPPAIR